MKKIYLVLVLLAICSSYLAAQQIDTFAVSDFQIQSFFQSIRNTISKNDTIVLMEEPSDIITRENLEIISTNYKIFSKADINFMIKQKEQRAGQYFNEKLIDKITLIKNAYITKTLKDFGFEKGWNLIRRTYHGGFITLSLPYFNLDYSMCIASVEIHCGAICGWGWKAIYKHEKSGWVIFKELSNWVS